MPRLSDEQVFGDTGVVAPPAARLSDDEVFATPESGTRLSDAEVFGAPQAQAPAAPLSPESPPRPEPPQAGGIFDTIDQYGREAVKQIGTGLIEAGVASGLRGIAAVPQSQGGLELQSAIEAIQKGADIDVAVQQGVAQPAAKEIPAETSYYRAGQDVSKAIGSDQPSPILHPVATDILRGVGSVGGSIISTPLTLGAGPILSGMGEALQGAVEKGATPEQQERAGQLGSIAGATDFADLLLVSSGGAGKALSLVKRIGLNALKGFFIEGGQEGLQQGIQNAIAIGVYDPDRPLFQDVPYNFFIGGVVGGVIKGAMPGDARPASKIGADAAALAPAYATLTGEALPVPVSVEAKLETPPVAAMDSTTEPGKATIVAQDAPLERPVFYSELRRVAEAKLPESASPQQILATLRNSPGVKQEEIEATGIEGFLASQPGRVSKAEVLAHLEENAVQVSEVVKNTNALGPDGNPLSRPFSGPSETQFGGYTVPGPKQGYRELLLTLPEKPTKLRPREWSGLREDPVDPNNFLGGHWEEPNVVAHIRFTTRTDAANQPVLHIEEIQSDWHQKGREFGYDSDKAAAEWDARMRPLEERSRDARDRMRQADEEQRRAVAAGDNIRASLARERGIAASELLDDALTEQANMGARPVATGAVPDAPFKTSWPELAMKRMVRWAADNGYSRISWNSGDLAAGYATGAGGNLASVDPKTLAGLREFYDRIIPSVARKIGKRFGGTLGATEIETRPGVRERVYFLDIPVAAQTQIQAGLSLFQHADPKREAATVRVDPSVEQNGGAAFKGAVTKAVGALNEYAQKFGYAGKVLIRVGWKNLTGSHGKASQLLNGNYIIDMDAATFNGNIANFWNTLTHEFGHTIMWEKFNALSSTEQLAIREAHKAWREESLRNGNAGAQMNTKTGATRTWVRHGKDNFSDILLQSLTPERRAYELSFEEWFADQVSRHAQTNQEAVGIIDRAISGISKALRLFQEFVATKLGLDPRPVLAMENWLNSYMTDAAPWSAQAYAALDLRTQKANQYYMATDVPAAPQQPTTAAINAALRKVFGGSLPPAAAKAAAHADRVGWLYQKLAGLLEMVDLNPRFTPIVNYSQIVQLMHIEEAKILDAGVRINKDWRNLGEQAENLAAFIDDVTNMVYRTPAEVKAGVTRHPTRPEFDILVRKHKLESPALTVFGQIKTFLDTFIQLNAQNAIDDATRLIQDPVARAARIDEVRGQVANLQSRPYFPFTRFGRHAITVRDAAGNVVFFRTYERKGLKSAEKVQAEAEARLVSQYGRDNVVASILPEETEHLVGMPSLLLESMAKKLTLTPAQLDALRQLQFEMSPSLSFKHRFQHKNYVPGYSSDFARAFASYTFFGARYFARTKYTWQLREQIKEAEKVGGVKASKLARFMADHLQNGILDTRGDYGTLKGLAFLWHLGYNVASAFVNMSQTFMVTYPTMATWFGDARAIKAMVRSMATMNNFYKKGYYNSPLGDFELRSMGYGIRTGRISETQAPELAGLGNARNLGYGYGTNGFQRAVTGFQEKAAWMFEMAEQWNRRVAWRAALELAMNDPNNAYVKEATTRFPEELRILMTKEGYSQAQARAIVTAVHAVQQTQFVYAAYNRPKAFRGKTAGAILVFQMYTKSLLMLFATQPKGFTLRYLLMAMAVGGLSGLPGYEELKGVIEAMLKHYGYNANFELEVRKFIRDHLDEKLLPPDLILHGHARRGFHIGAILDALGSLATGRPGRGFLQAQPGQNVPFPIVDLSKSITTGHVLPVDLGKILGPQSDVDKTISQQTARASGAVFSVGFNMYKAIFDSKMAASDPKRWERAVPKMLGAVSKGFRLFEDERERSAGGRLAAPTSVRYDPRDPEHNMEIIAQMMGYNTLRSQQKWDQVMMQAEHIAFLKAQRSNLYSQMTEAILGKNDVEKENVRQSILRFNEGLRGTPDRGMSITSEGVQQSVAGRIREKYAKEKGVTTRRGEVPIAREIQSLFPESTIDAKRL